MSADSKVPMVRCHLEGGDNDPALALRYVPSAEFELWRHFMETRHARTVIVEDVSVWVPEAPEAWSEDLDPEALQPVLRVRFERSGPQGMVVPVVNGLADRGVRVIVAGLDQDYMGRPFDPMPQILAIAEYVDKILAICMQCGAPANRTQRLTNATDRVVVGGAEEYEARCRRCFQPPTPTVAAEQPPTPMVEVEQPGTGRSET